MNTVSNSGILSMTMNATQRASLVSNFKPYSTAARLSQASKAAVLLAASSGLSTRAKAVRASGGLQYLIAAVA